MVKLLRMEKPFFLVIVIRHCADNASATSVEKICGRSSMKFALQWLAL
jgi:hypothetical protein